MKAPRTPDESVQTLTAIVRSIVDRPEVVVATLGNTGVLLWVADEDLQNVTGKNGETLRALTWAYRAMCRNPAAKLTIETAVTL